MEKGFCSILYVSVMKERWCIDFVAALDSLYVRTTLIDMTLA